MQNLDTVALLIDIPAYHLMRGHVGTIVEGLGGVSVLVEFCDEQGYPYALVPVRDTDILGLRYGPNSA